MFAPLHVHSHLSLLDGLAKASQIADRCEELGYTACAITDHGNISGTVDFNKAMKKKNIKPIYGMEAYIVFSKDVVKHQLILAKNLQGWKKLIKLVSKSAENFYYNPRISLTLLEEYCSGGDFISLSGHEGSTLHHFRQDEPKAIQYIEKMQSIFGKENFFIEVQNITTQNYVNADFMRSLARKTGALCVATPDAHYAKREDAIDHRVLMCGALKKTLKQIEKEISYGTNVAFNSFFKTNNFHIPSVTELLDCKNTESEIKNSMLVADMCENYDITNRPKLPTFDCPNNMSERDYLRHLCREGWIKKNKNWDRQIYGDRVKYELDVINTAQLDGYFLIVQDYVNYGKRQGWLMGPGRGSAAGSLIAYLTGITNVDPIPLDLLFERFYNPGRNTKDRVSYPDIDVDVPVHKREKLLQYAKDKYGHEKVCHIATYGRLQGRGAVSEVFRVNDVCGFEEIKEITKSIPQEFQIADALEESNETSILKWTLENEPKVLGDYCYLTDDGKLGGQYAQWFEQAIRLEGTYKSRGKHPAGIIISSENLDDACPMIWDTHSEEKIAGMDMGDLEELGLVKFDILGIVALDRLAGVNQLLRYGSIK